MLDPMKHLATPNAESYSLAPGISQPKVHICCLSFILAQLLIE